MAKKYIDAEAAFKVMQDISNHYHETYVSNARAETAEWCLKKLKELPAANVVEVWHGHWMWDGYVYDAPWQCSNCGGFHAEDSNYCPNCGARMDEEYKRK